MLKEPPLSLYIHFPWCIRKCPYCDFNSHQQRGELPEKTYIDALLQDADQLQSLVQHRPIISIFMGGGTPSLFSAASLQFLLTELRKRFQWQPHIEITIEANPGTFEQDKFQAYFDIGINRISLGVQSFTNDSLEKLGRVHNAEEAIQAAKYAKKVGFSVNIDLMFALPQQDIKNALSDLQTAISLNPDHISWYQLTIEPNTVFYKKPPLLPEDDLIADIEMAGKTLLAQNNYHQYEISAYAKKDKQCQHNLNYWRFGDYLGIGAGAHQKLTHQNEIIRSQRHKMPASYLQQIGNTITEQLTIPKSELPFEFMLNALRLHEASAYENYEAYTGLSIKDLMPTLIAAEKKGLIELTDLSFQTTALGKQFLNDLLKMIMD